MKFLKDITEEYSEDVINIMEAISASVKQLKGLQKHGKVITNKMVKDFMKSNSKLTMAASLNAISSHAMYKTNTRNTISLFAKTAYDKRLTKSIVDAMLKTKKFKLHRTRYAENGKYWELKKIKSGF